MSVRDRADEVVACLGNEPVEGLLVATYVDAGEHFVALLELGAGECRLAECSAQLGVDSTDAQSKEPFTKPPDGIGERLCDDHLRCWRRLVGDTECS
ncbi:Uncharacterised protein [Mycobacteroides abscessus subsp. abscessus]|nr:Uncharacterised protein [Mycobacteroides abscessus subsp. abscessus]